MASIRKRNGKYTVIYDYYTKDGERKQKSKTFTNEKEAKKFKNQVEGEKLNNTLVIDSNMPLRDYLSEWASIYGKEKWQYNTYTANKGLIANHIIPELGDVPLQNITPLMIEVFMSKLKNKRVIGAKSYNKEEADIPLLTPTTARHVYFVLKTAFDKAVEWQMLKENPVKCKAPTKLKSKRKAWEVELVRAILADIEHKQLHLAVHLAFICSLRIGEVVGLTWDCVDFENNEIYINKTIQRIDKEAFNSIPPSQLVKVFKPKVENKKSFLILKNPKTEESTRYINITEPLRKELMARKEYLEKRKSFFDDEFEDYNLVFSADDGSPIEPKLCERWFSKWQKRTSLDVSGLIFHEIRHSSSTYKLHVSGGDIKSVQGDTGHASASMVLDTYSHTMKSNRMKLMKQVEEDFYETLASPAKKERCKGELPSDIGDLVSAIKTNPEIQQQLLVALLGGENNQ